jgi:hypothetical protein
MRIGGSYYLTFLVWERQGVFNPRLRTLTNTTDFNLISTERHLWERELSEQVEGKESLPQLKGKEDLLQLLASLQALSGIFEIGQFYPNSEPYERIIKAMREREVDPWSTFSESKGNLSTAISSIVQAIAPTREDLARFVTELPPSVRKPQSILGTGTHTVRSGVIAEIPTSDSGSLTLVFRQPTIAEIGDVSEPQTENANDTPDKTVARTKGRRSHMLTKVSKPTIDCVNKQFGRLVDDVRTQIDTILNHSEQKSMRVTLCDLLDRAVKMRNVFKEVDDAARKLYNRSKQEQGTGGSRKKGFLAEAQQLESKRPEMPESCHDLFSAIPTQDLMKFNNRYADAPEYKKNVIAH